MADLKVVGYSGLKQWHGYIYEEFMRQLQGPRAIKVYREMSDNSDTLGAIRYLIKTLVRQVDWRIKPSSEVDEAKDVAAFVESCLKDMSMTFDDFISEVLSFLDYGWAYFEIVYKIRKGRTKNPQTNSRYSDGKVGWRKFGLRAQDTLDKWEFDSEDGGLRGMYQLTEKGESAFIPIEKSILFRTETYKNNPEGRSIYRNAVVPWFFLKRISEIEAIGIERDLTGLPVMEVPEQLLMTNAPDELKVLRREFERMLAEIKRDERAFAMVPSETDKEGKPSGYKLKLLSSGGQHQVDTNQTKIYYKTGIFQSTMTQFIQLGTANVGSWALASSQTNLFSTALGAYLDLISETFDRFAISRLMEENGIDSELWPKLVHGDIESPPLDELGRYLQVLGTIGKLPEDEELDRQLLEIANLHVPNIEEATEETKTTRRKGKAPIKTLASIGEK